MAAQYAKEVSEFESTLSEVHSEGGRDDLMDTEGGDGEGLERTGTYVLGERMPFVSVTLMDVD